MKKSSAYKNGLIIGLVTTAIVSILMCVGVAPLTMLERKLYDYRFRLRGKINPPDEIVIAAIDEKSIKKIGRWPWGRERIADLIVRIAEEGAALTIIDIMFNESAEGDNALEGALWDTGNILLPIAIDNEKVKKMSEPDFLLNSSIQSIEEETQFEENAPFHAKGIFLPLEFLAKGALGVGHISIFPDDDGVLRKELLIFEYNSHLYPSLDLLAASYYLGVPPKNLTVVATKGVAIGKKRFLMTDEWGRILIPYYGTDRIFSRISVSDILEGNLPPDALKGKLVLVGSTALGLYDLVVSPFTPVMPGIEKHATVIASILEGNNIIRAPFWSELLLVLLSGALLSSLIARFKATGASVAASGFIFFYFFIAIYFFSSRQIWLTMTYPLLNTTLIFIVITSYKYMVEEKYAKKVRAMFANYSTEKVVTELINNPEMGRLGGELREVTVLFSDIIGFTTFSENHSPQEVVSLLNEYLTAMTDIVLKWDGTLDKFIGDAIVVFWGAPLKQEDHAEYAVECAVEMIDVLKTLQEKWKREGKAVLDIGIGLNTGEVIVGNIGSEGKKMDYTVIGDHVNLGARMESLTRKYKTHILLTEFTFQAIKKCMDGGKEKNFSVQPLEKVTVKGKSKPVMVYKVLFKELLK